MLTAIIVDDELPAIEKLERQMQETGMIDCVGTFTDSHDALVFLQTNKVSVALLDIEMPKMSGLKLAAKITELHSNISIIFVTAYNQFAVEAFRLNALDYLMKPIQKKQLIESITRHPKENDQLWQPIIEKKLKITCFGKFTVAIGNVEIRFRTKKAGELLALLIDRKGRPVHRNDIIDIMWEDFEGDRAVINFNTTLYTMKKSLIKYSQTNPIISDRGFYSIDTNYISCDYFELMESMNKKNKNVAEKIRSLYIEEYLAGHDYFWCVENREMIRRKVSKFLNN